ncbi:MAG: inositol monophosphatase [Ilumatobacteraceae bacterium]|jgi:myo-inositol-1(or 4)-monophosphatase|nr:inositol monophosphatase [Ilumatobacteraceae bacterium]
MSQLGLGNELRAIAEQLARAAGDMALAGRKSGDVTATTKSSPTDMVTQYDKASEDMITAGLRDLRPDDGIVGEEGASRDGTSGITWHIDPIDGTSNFYFDIPMWAVSIGAVDEHGPIAGAVYAPALGDMFTAARGEGATLNGNRISVRDNTVLSDALVCTGFSYHVSQREEHAKRVATMVGQIRDIRRFGAAAIDLCFVACGRLDAYFEEHLNSWDLIAGQVIATEAGAIVTNFSGDTVTPQEVLATQPGVQKALIRLIADSTKA